MNTLNVRSALKKNSIVFFTYKKLTDQFYRSGLIDYLTHKQIKSRETIRKELDLMSGYWGCDPMDYYTYRLYEKNLSSDELLDYVPHFFFYNYYVPSLYSPERFDEAASKIRLNRYFTSRNIRTPRVIAEIIKGKILVADAAVSFERFAGLLTGSKDDRFFMKPDTGKGGKGIYMIEKAGNELFFNKRALTAELFSDLTSHKDFIVQAALRQRDDIMEIYPNSVNTLRVITQNFNSEPVICAVMLRIGRNGNYVDNGAAGGISASVDLETGRIDKYAIDIENNVKFFTHPDTGTKFDGFVFREWDKIKDGILEIARKAPEYPDVAWDIAVMDDGVVAIELNLNYGILMQGVVGGMRRKLKIDLSKIRHRSLSGIPAERK